MGWPYFARFSGVSATGPFVTTVSVKVAPPTRSVTDLEAAAVTSSGRGAAVADNAARAVATTGFGTRTADWLASFAGVWAFATPARKATSVMAAYPAGRIV
jgi:hypothetical protein